MTQNDLISRFSTRVDRVNAERYAPTNSAIVGTAVGRDKATGLLKYETADGGIGFTRAITPRAFAEGDRIPALVAGNDGASYGFGDARF
jgi:hypothetical protein